MSVWGVGEMGLRIDITSSPKRARSMALIEWPEGGRAAQILASTCRKRSLSEGLVDLTSLRWRIERDYQDLNRGRARAFRRARVGVASTTTLRCASPRPTDSWSPRGGDSPSVSRSTRPFKNTCGFQSV